MLADRLGHEKVSSTLNTYSHLFPHKQQELVHSLESLQATDSPTPEPPSDNPLLEAAGITCEVPQMNIPVRRSRQSGVARATCPD